MKGNLNIKRAVVSGLFATILTAIIVIGVLSTGVLPRQAVPAATQAQIIPTLTLPVITVTPPFIPEEASLLVREGDFGVWKYRAVRNDFAGLKANVTYDHATISDLQAYVAANRALIPGIAQAGGTAEIALSFHMPVAPAQFRTWAREKGLQVRQAQLAVGSSTTLMIGGTEYDALPQESIDSFAFSGMGGVFGVYGSVDAARLSEIASDPHVFLVDVTPAWVRRDLIQAGVPDAAQVNIQVALPFGWMEKLGMVPTRVPIPGPVGTIIPATAHPSP